MDLLQSYKKAHLLYHTITSSVADLPRITLSCKVATAWDAGSYVELLIITRSIKFRIVTGTTSAFRVILIY